MAQEEIKILKDKSCDELLETLDSYHELNVNSIPFELGKELITRIYPSHSYINMLDIGGESAIFLTKDPTNRYCAIKVPHYRLTHIKEYKRDIFKKLILGAERVIKTYEPNKYIERFKEGVKIQVQLSENTNSSSFIIPKVYNVNINPLSYSMEYIEGIKILNWITQKHNLIESIELFIKVLDAIKFAHDYGVIHRDLKSDNILFTNNHKVVILDWTLSKVIGRNLTVAGSDLPMGSMPYASPKQLLLRHAGDSTYPDDIFSLGITMYEFITFKKLSVVKNYNNSLDSINKYILALSNTLPDFIKPIFIKATAVDEKDRYVLVDEYMEDMFECLRKAKVLSTSKTELVSQTSNIFDCSKCKYNCKYNICSSLSELYKLLKEYNEK